MKKANIKWVLLLFTLLFLTGAGLFAFHKFSQKRDSYTFKACVLTKEKSYLVVYGKGIQSENEVAHVDIGNVPVTDSDGKSAAAGAIEPGQMIQVTVGGEVLTVAPPIYPTVYRIDILREKNDALYHEGLKASARYFTGVSS